MPTLADLVGDVDGFRRDHVFRRTLLTHLARLDALPDVDALWNDLLRRGTRQPGFRVVRSGTTVSSSEVARRAGFGGTQVGGVVAPNAVIGRYRDGHTVVLQGLHHSDPELAKFANNLALALDHPVQINAYLSPSSARGLDLHFDYHDVFVLQLQGLKRWRVWKPLDRTVDPVKGSHTIAAPRLQELGAPELDVTLRTGDCLYVPRGFPHSAETIEEHSAHLTVGVVAITWHRVLRRAIDEEVGAGRLTGSVPVGMLDPNSAAPVGAVDLGGLRRQLEPDVLRHWMAREVWRRQAATRLRPRESPVLGPARLAFTPGPLIWLTMSGDRAVLGLGDRILDLPEEAFDFLFRLLETVEPVVASELQGLDTESRSVVLRRLLAEGVLVHVD